MSSAVWRAVPLVGLLMTAASALGAQGAHFTAFRTERFDVWSEVPAYRARTYIGGAKGTVRVDCDIAVTPNAEAIEVAKYMMTRPPEGLEYAYYQLMVSGEDNAFLLIVDPERDVQAHVHATSCAQSEHSGWLAATEKFLADPRLGGSITKLVLSGCQEHAARPGGDCHCFARAFDMEASPRRRRALLDAPDILAAFRELLSDGNFRDRAGYKCGSVPDFFTPPLPSTALWNAQLRLLSSQMAQWYSSDQSARDDVARAAEARAAREYIGVREAEHSDLTGTAIVLHVCNYGPPSPQVAVGKDDEGTLLFWDAWPSPSQAELQRDLANYRYLKPMLEAGHARVNACPPTLPEAQALKAGPAVIEARRAPAPVRSVPATPVPQREPEPSTRQPRQEAHEARCAGLLERLKRSRIAVLTGTYSARNLLRQEAFYAANCR